MDVTIKVPNNRQRALSLSVDETLKDLEVDGYQVVFTTRVALMPVALADTRSASPDGSERNG